MRRASGLAAALALSLGTTACQTYAPTGFPPGTPLADIQQAMGRPTATYPLAGGGQRVEFARGPHGRHTFMVDVDAGGRMVRVEQVLTEAHFATVQIGQTRDQVLRTLGHPSDVRTLGYQKRQLWSYRHDAIFCVWYQVSFDTQGLVVDTGQGPDPACDRDEQGP